MIRNIRVSDPHRHMTIPLLRAPIVLVHGLLGFDRVRVGNYTIACYFPGIAEALRGAGNRVLVPTLSPTAGIAQRAQQLKDFLQKESPGEPVHLLAHSMGGLDARWMIANLGMEERVLTLTTLGTPHRGTAFADWGVTKFDRLLRPVLDFLSVPMQAFHDLTTSACRAFNEGAPDSAKVRYFSVAGQHDGSYLAPGWLLPYGVVLRAEGPNDGVVSQASANYGEHLEVWEGDHFSLVNWLNPMGYSTAVRDAVPRYGSLVRRLADLGF
jgi:triacylglycerol lipase